MSRPRRVSRELVKIEMAEDILGMSARSIRAAVARGSLKSYRPGGGKYSRLMFDRDDLESFLDDSEV